MNPQAAHQSSWSIQHLLPWAVCLLLLAGAAPGLTPIVPLEGDDQGVLFGLEAMARGDPLLLHWRYAYEIQPGFYHFVLGLQRAFGGDFPTWFQAATIGGAALFAGASAWLIHTVLSVPFAWSLASIIWCQESLAAASYLNTSALACGVAAVAFLPFATTSKRSGLLLGGVGLGVAGWLRADSLLIAPAAAALLGWKQSWHARSLTTLGFATLAGLATLLLLRELSGSPLREAFSAYGARPNFVGSFRTSRDAILTWMSPAMLAAACVGALLLLQQRRYSILLIIATGIGPTALLYGGSLVTTKYLYAALPFAVLPAVVALSRLWQWASTLSPLPRRAVLAALAIGASADLMAGIRVMPAEAQFLGPSSPQVSFATFELAGRPLSLGLGAGDCIPNEDGFRVRTGHFFAGAEWHREKLHLATVLGEFDTLLAQPGHRSCYVTAWLPEQLLKRQLLRAGFKPETAAARRWTRDASVVTVEFLLPSVPRESRVPAAPNALPEICLSVYGGQVPPEELNDGRHWRVQIQPARGLVTLYSRN